MPDLVLHYGKDDVGLVFDGCESHRCDHHDHEIECLNLVSVDGQPMEPKTMKYTPSWQTSTRHLRVLEYGGVRSQRGITKSYRAIQLRRKC